MKNFIFYSSVFIALTGLLLTSCVKRKFDDPPDTRNYDPKLTVTHSIWQLKKMYYDNGNSPIQINSEVIISGVVTADDQSGNFYKQIIIQDSTSGIPVLLNRSSGLYNDYPIGRKIYIRCKGLWLAAYGNFIQLGGGINPIDNSLYEIPSKNIEQYLVKANYPNAVDTLHVTLPQIMYTNTTQTEQQRQWLGRILVIDSLEFDPSEVGQTFALDPNITSGTDRHLMDCPGSTIVVRNSGYASFRLNKLPGGNGSVVAIYSTYESGTKKTPQLLLRDTTDLQLYHTRCNGTVVNPPVDITIDSLRKLYIGADTNKTIVLGNYLIHGVVTSSLSDSNISVYNLILQDESGKGIVVYYSGKYNYAMGDSLVIDVSGQALTYYRGTLEVSASNTSGKTTKVGSGKTVAPITVTIAQLNADLGKPNFNERLYENVLVKVNNCTIAGTPTTYNGSKTISDNGTDNIILFTFSKASFSGLSCPTTPVSITGIASIYGKYVSQNTKQISMRNSSDVQ